MLYLIVLGLLYPCKFYHTFHLVFLFIKNVCYRHRKYNAITNSNVVRPIFPDFNTFSTDFGVEFGHIIGHDLLFRSPSTYFGNNIKNLVFPTTWESSLPFLSSKLIFLCNLDIADLY